MTAVDLSAFDFDAAPPQPGNRAITYAVRHGHGRRRSNWPRASIRIGKGILAELGWKANERFNWGWGRGEHHGTVILVRAADGRFRLIQDGTNGSKFERSIAAVGIAGEKHSAERCPLWQRVDGQDAILITLPAWAVNRQAPTNHDRGDAARAPAAASARPEAAAPASQPPEPRVPDQPHGRQPFPAAQAASTGGDHVNAQVGARADVGKGDPGGARAAASRSWADDVPTVRQMVSENKSNEEIAAAIGRSVQAVATKLTEIGLKRTPEQLRAIAARRRAPTSGAAAAATKFSRVEDALSFLRGRGFKIVHNGSGYVVGGERMNDAAVLRQANALLCGSPA